MSKILVTGGCGYVGSRLIPMLLADGHQVTCLDVQYFGDGALPVNGNLKIIKGDVRSGQYAIPEQPDVLIHLASISQNDMYKKDPALTECVNRSIPQFPVERLIYASSVAVYGSSENVMDEDYPLRPTTPYGKDKLLCEQGILSVGGTCVRAASICGHSPNMRFDTPINRMTRAALTGRQIEVYGGNQRRCHVHLDNLCDFYRLLLKVPKEKISGEAFNVSDEFMRIRTSAELVQMCCWLELDPPIEYLPATDMRSYMVSSRKASDVLDWKPKRTIKDAILEMKANRANPQYRDFSPARVRML